MPTYGDPNMVGYRQESPYAGVKPWLAPAAAGAVGGRLAYTAARPNTSGRIRSAEANVQSVQDRITNELKYKKPRADLLAAHELDLGRAKRASATVKRTVMARHTPKLRAIRGVAGGTLLAGSGALALRQLKRQKAARAPDLPIPGGPSASLR